jgi:hypothetical protein
MMYLINKYIISWIGVVGFMYLFILDQKNPDTFKLVMGAVSPLLLYVLFYLISLPFFINYKILNGYQKRYFRNVKIKKLI